MNLLMVSGDRSMLAGKHGAFWHTLRSLSQEWDRIDVICPRVPGASEAAVFFGNVYFHSSPYSLLRQPRWIVRRGLQLLALYKHDVMTVHDYPPFYNGIGARRLAAFAQVPYVLEIHHIVGYPVAASLTEYIGRWMSCVYLPIASRKASAIRTVSKDAAETLTAWGVSPAKVRVVPSFYLDTESMGALGSPPPVHYDVVFCGRLVPNKGVKQLLQAIAKVPRSTLLVIGDGPQRKELENMAKSLAIAPRVEFRGWLPTQKDVLRAILSAKMLVMNSTSEGGPRVPLEAMACGMPVIVTRVGVMPDVIEDGKNGLFTTGRPDDLAEKIRMLMEDEAWRTQMGQRAKSISERFERSRLIGQYARFLKSVAE